MGNVDDSPVSLGLHTGPRRSAADHLLLDIDPQELRDLVLYVLWEGHANAGSPDNLAAHVLCDAGDESCSRRPDIALLLGHHGQGSRQYMLHHITPPFSQTGSWYCTHVMPDVVVMSHQMTQGHLDGWSIGVHERHAVS